MGEDSLDCGKRGEKYFRNLIKPFGWNNIILNKDIGDVDINSENKTIGIDGIYNLPGEKNRYIYVEFKFLTDKPPRSKIKKYLNDIFNNINKINNSEYINERVDDYVYLSALFLWADKINKNSIDISFYENGRSRVRKPHYCFFVDNKYICRLQIIKDAINEFLVKEFFHNNAYIKYLSPFQIDNDIICCQVSDNKGNNEENLFFYFGDNDIKRIKFLRNYLKSKFKSTLNSRNSVVKLFYTDDKCINDLKPIRENAQTPDVELKFQELPILKRSD